MFLTSRRFHALATSNSSRSRECGHGNRICRIASGKFSKRKDPTHTLEGEQRRKGERVEYPVRTVVGEWIDGYLRAASKTRIERRDKPNKTEPSLESTKPNPSKERQRGRERERLAKRQTYLIQVGRRRWREKNELGEEEDIPGLSRLRGLRSLFGSAASSL